MSFRRGLFVRPPLLRSSLEKSIGARPRGVQCSIDTFCRGSWEKTDAFAQSVGRVCVSWYRGGFVQSFHAPWVQAGGAPWEREVTLLNVFRVWF